MKLFFYMLVATITAGCSSKLSEDTSFIHVQGLYSESRVNTYIRTRTSPVKSSTSDKFSYIPNSGLNENEAIVVRSWNMATGPFAEEILLRVLFGVKEKPNKSDYREKSKGEKHYHIYSIITSDGQSQDVYFDATQYHNLY